MSMDHLRAALPGWVIFRLPTGGWVACPRAATADSPLVYAPNTAVLYHLVTRLN